MPQLNLRAQSKVSRQQTKNRRLWQRSQVLHKPQNSRTDPALAFMQNVVEPKYVSLEKPLKILRRFGDAMKAEKLPDQAHVRASGELQPFKPVHGIKFRRKDFGKGLHPRTPGSD